MSEPRNRVVQVKRFGDLDGLEVVEAPMPTASRGEVRARVLASGMEYSDVVIRRISIPIRCAASRHSCWATTSSEKSISSAMA